MKKLLLFALLALWVLAKAQPTSRLVQAVIQSVETKKPGEWKLVLQKPEGLSLKDSLGFVVGLHATSPYRNRNISAVTVIEISGKTITATASTFDDIKPGDVVFLHNTLPDKFPFTGKLHNAYLNGVLMNSLSSPPSGLPSASHGAGGSTFLTSLERVPQIYIGRELNLNDEYAKWVKAGSIDYGVIDLFIEALAKDSDFESLKKSQKQNITRDFLLNLTNGANVIYNGAGPLEAYVNTMKAISRLAPDVLMGDDLGFVYFSCGSALDIAEKYQEALHQFELSAKAYQSTNPIQYARAMSRQAECVKQLGELEKSSTLFSETVGLWKQIIAKDPSLYNYSLLRIQLEGLAKCASDLGQHQRYVSAYEELAGIYKKLNLMSDRGIAFWSLGYAYGEKLEQTFSAIEFYEKAYQVFDSVKNVNNAVTVLCNQAINYRTLKDFKSALEVGQRAEAYAKANLNMEAEADALTNILDTYKALENNEQALETARKLEKLYSTLGLADKLTAVKDEIASLTTLGKANGVQSSEEDKLIETLARHKRLIDNYKKLDMNEQAMAATGQALETARQLEKLYSNLGLNEKLAPVKDEIATLAAALEKTDEATQASEEALILYQGFATGEQLADAYWNTAIAIGVKNGRVEESCAYFRKAFDYYKDHSATNATTLLSNIAFNYRDVGDSTRSYHQHREAVKFANASQDTTAIISSHDRFYHSYKLFKDYKGIAHETIEAGMLYHSQKNSEKAGECFDKTLEALDTLISRYDNQKKHDQAANAYTLMSQIYLMKNDTSEYAKALNGLGYELEYTSLPNAQATAITYYKRASGLYQQMERHFAVSYMENSIARMYREMGKYDSAFYHVEVALSKGQKSEVWARIADAYQQKAKILVALKKYDGPEDAIKNYEKADVAFGKVPDKTSQMKCMGNLADLLNELKRHDAAAKKHLQRIALVGKKDEATLASINFDYGYTVSLMPGKLKESNEYYHKSAALYKKLSDYSNYVLVMNNVAINFRDAKDSVNCYKIASEVITLVSPMKSNPELVENYYQALENVGKHYNHFGHHSQALKVRLQAAEGYELLANYEKAYSLFEDAGKSADDAKKYIEAEKYYYQSRAMGDKLGDKKKVGSALWSIAYNKYTYQLKPAEAIPIWETAYNMYLEAGDTANASVMRSNVGQTYWGLLDFDKAIENHNKAIEIATKGKYLPQVAGSWTNLATLYNKTKNPTKESEARFNALKILEVLKDTVKLLPAYFSLGNSYEASEETAKAEDYYNKALVLAMAKKDSSNVANAYYNFGNLYYSKKPDRAKENYQKAIVLQRKLKEKTNLIYSLAFEGMLGVDTDRPGAEKSLNEALGLAVELKLNSMIALCHGRLYTLFREIGKPDMAHQHMESSIQLYKELDDKVSLLNNYIAYSTEYRYDYGDLIKSQQYMAEAKVLLDSATGPLTLANYYGEQSDIYSDLGQNDQALAELDKSKEIYERLSNQWGLAGLYISYGNIYKDLNDYGRAMSYEAKSDSLYNALNSQYSRLAPLANIGGVYFTQGDYPKALEYFKQSLKLIEDNKDQNTNLCKLLTSVGETYSYMTNYEEAEKWFVRALETSKRINAARVGSSIMNSIGKLKIETKKYDEAEKYLLEARTFLINQNLMLTRTENATLLGQLYLSKGELEKGKAELTEAISLAEKFEKEATLWEAYFRMGGYYRKSNNLKESKNYLLKSVGVIDKLRGKIVGGEEAQKLFSSDKWILEAYEELISVLLELGETEEAMAWLQKINENNTRDKMRSMDVTFEDDEKNKALTREKELKMKLDAMEKQIAASKQAKNTNTAQIKNLEATRNIAEGDYLKFVNQTINVQPELSKYFSNTVQPSQLKGKKKQIPKDMALVSYLVGEKQLYIFVATSDTVVARIVSVTKEKIHRDVNAMGNITKSHLGTFGTIDLKTQEAERKETVSEVKQTDQMLKPFEEAYNYLISPISGLISGKARLGIIPTGELNYIPFQMLGKTLKNNKFSMLINQFSMFYTNSTDMLLRTVVAGDKTLHILAFGNPDKTLPATEKEVNDIKKIFPNTMVYVQGEASEDKAKFASEEYNVMHFATHGNLDYEDFSKSYLTMAGNKGKNEDGMLTLEELWGMEVMSHLNIVVLSACQTAVTKGSDESSPVSPASGFLQNGVKSVVASLWKVDDEATAILMNEFYKNIKTMDAVDAMRAAQSNLSNNPKFNHPYYWAAMVLIGDWR